MRFIRAVTRLYLAPGASVKNAETVLKRYSDFALWELVECDHPESVPDPPHGLPFDEKKGTLLHGRWIPHAWLRTTERKHKLLSMLYSMKRGFPFPCVDAVEAALKKHEETLAASAPDTQPINDFARDWAAGFANELAKLGPLPSVADLPSSSTACLEYTIKEGGRARYVKEKIQASPWLKAFEVKGEVSDAAKRAALLHAALEDLRDQGFAKLVPVMSKAGYEGAIAPSDRPCNHTTVFRTHCLECGEIFVRFKRTDKVRSVRVSPVLEQGFKVRPITVNNGAWATLMHLPRLWMFAMLGRCAEIPSLYLLGKRRNPVSVARSGLKRNRFAELNSLDLSSATDNFSKPLCSALYEGFTRLCPPLIREIGRETFRPVDLVYRHNGKSWERRSTSKGILMGDPCSWSVLNLHNIFLWRLADEIANYTGRVFTAKLSDLGPFRVPKTVPAEDDVVRCGDDQFAVSRPTRCRNFEALLTAVGAVISKGAHFASSNWGFYTKCIFRKKPDGEFSFYDYFPTRFVLGPMRTRPGEREIPPFWNIGPACRTGLSWFEMGDPERVTEFSHAYWIAGWINRKPIRKMLTVGVEPFLPRELGGFGLPDSRGNYLAITGFGKAMWDMALRDDVTVKSWLLLHLASFVWSLHQTKAAKAVKSALLFLRTFCPTLLGGFSDSYACKVLGDPGNPLGISRDPKKPHTLTEAVSAFMADRYTVYDEDSLEIPRAPAFWRIGVRFRTLAARLVTPYRAKKHKLPVKAVEEVIARAQEWRCDKLPPVRSAEAGAGFRKVVLADEGIPRRNCYPLEIDFVPEPDLARILDAAGVQYPKTVEAAKSLVEREKDRLETQFVHFGTRIVSWKAILRAPPQPFCDDLRGYHGITNRAGDEYSDTGWFRGDLP